MNKVQRSQAFLRKRKMMMVLPLLVVPFLTMAFWAMGGGKNSNDKIKQPQQQGLNLQLPNANLKDDKMVDKMSFYDQADKDSIKLAEQMRNDPYFRGQDSMQKVYSNQLEQITQSSAEKFKQPNIIQNSGLKTSPYDKLSTPAEEKVMKKLAELNIAINQPEKDPSKYEATVEYKDTDGYNFGNDVNRLENMLNGMNDKGNERDPEIKQLDNTLDKILDIQHPERVKDRIKEKSLKNKQVAFPVGKIPKENNVSLLQTVKSKSEGESGFFGLTDESLSQDNEAAIEAVVHENQTLVNGAVVKLRLLSDVYINGFLIPKGNFVFGIASLNAERLEIEINSIRCNQSLYNVKLEVYDIDGLPGIYIPGAITRDVAKQSVDNSLQLMELSSMDPSFKAQAAAAGIGAAKSLLSKKVKQVKVIVKAGYKVFLKDKNIEQ
jgi:conjugative transposon TraM protein